MFEKIVVAGPEKHPLYPALIGAQPNARGAGAQFREKLVGYGITPTPEPEVFWNFEKFLIAKDGSVAARFSLPPAPHAAGLVAAIEAELEKQRPTPRHDTDPPTPAHRNQLGQAKRGIDRV